MIHHQRTFEGKTLYDTSFELQELIDGPTHKVRNYHGSEAREWLGAPSTEAYVNFVRTGVWPEVAAQFRSMLGKLPAVDRTATQNMRMRRKRTRGDFGNELDIHAVRQGRIDRAWDRLEHSPKWSVQNKLIHVYVNMRCSSNTEAANLLWRAAVAYRVQEALAAAGYSVAITVARFGGGEVGNALTIQSVQVKAYGQDVSDDRLATLMHGAFYRHYLLYVGRWMIPGYHPSVGGLYSAGGNALPLHIEQEVERGAAVVRIGEEVCSEYGAINAVNAIIESLNSKSAVQE